MNMSTDQKQRPSAPSEEDSPVEDSQASKIPAPSAVYSQNCSAAKPPLMADKTSSN